MWNMNCTLYICEKSPYVLRNTQKYLGVKRHISEITKQFMKNAQICIGKVDISRRIKQIWQNINICEIQVRDI